MASSQQPVLKPKLWWRAAGTDIRVPARENPAWAEFRARYLENVKAYFGDDREYVHSVCPIEQLLGGHSVFGDPSKTQMYRRMYEAGDPPHPLVVNEEPTPNGMRYHILDGNRRQDAATAAKQTHVPIIIVREKSKTTEAKPKKKDDDKPPKKEKKGESKSMKKSEGFESPEWVKHPKLPPRVKRLFNAVRASLSDDLLLSDRRGVGPKHPLKGHCYVASEALWNLLDGSKTGWVPHHIQHEGDSHWYLVHTKTGTVLDPTAEQFETPVPYEKGRGKGFLTGDPSRRAQQVIDRVKTRLGKSADELFVFDMGADDLSKSTQFGMLGVPNQEVFDLEHEPTSKLRGLPHVLREGVVRAKDTTGSLGELHYYVDRNLPDTVHASSIIVNENARGRGIGTAMLDHLRRKVRGYRYISADTTSQGSFNHLMRRFGKPVYLTDGIRKLTVDEAKRMMPEKGFVNEDGQVEPQGGMTYARFPYKKAERFDCPLEELVKSISTIQPGVAIAHNPVTGESMWDYSHVLPIPARGQYRVTLHHVPRTNTLRAVVHHGELPVGDLLTYSDIEDGRPVLAIHNVQVDKDHRRHGLGLALYEAAYAHARHYLHIGRVVGDDHTAASDGVHQKLARKHGLDYQPAYRRGAQAGLYDYLIKGEELSPRILDPEQPDLAMHQEHALPSHLEAEGYRLNIAHDRHGAIATVHRMGHLVGHVGHEAGELTEEWTQHHRPGLREAVLLALDAHQNGHYVQDGWNEPIYGAEPLAKSAQAAVPQGFGHEHVSATTENPSTPKTLAGSSVTQPHESYEQARTAKPKPPMGITPPAGNSNLWVRPKNAGPTNHGRTLMVQFSSDLLQGGRQRDASDDYYDKLYQNRAGYHRADDFWELPQWQAHLAHSMPDADHYTVRNLDEAAQFFKQAGYRNVAFSALDVNRDHVKQLAQQVPNQRFIVGGYTDMSHFHGLPNVNVHPTIQSFVESEGRQYRPGYDYRHFVGTKTIPRLTLSDGCRHQCTFCSVPRQLTEKPREEILAQADEIAKQPAELVYLNDKTFGQAPNHAMLPEIYQRIKVKNPNFKGFIVQTTAAQMKRMTPEFIRDAGIKHVELGVETYNDSILRAHKKPANEQLIEEAAQKLRQAGTSLIPNIMVGLPGENRETYGRTMGWLNRNRDIISHVNAYNLALYEQSELGQKLGALSNADRDENQTTKSWHQDPQVHRDFHQAIMHFGAGQLDSEPFAAGTGKPL